MNDTESTVVLSARAESLVASKRGLLKDLAALRVEHGLSRREVAERMGCDETFVAEFEHYDANPPLADVGLYALAVGARITHTVIDDATYLSSDLIEGACDE